MPTQDKPAEVSPWASQSVPSGWQSAWLDGSHAASVGNRGNVAQNAGGDNWAVEVFVTSIGADRRTTRNCRWMLEFFANKKVCSPYLADSAVLFNARTNANV